MTKDNKTFDKYLETLKKDELSIIVDDYNKFATIYKEEPIVIKGVNKDNLVKLIIDKKNNYVKYILSIINVDEYKELLSENYTGDFSKFLFKYHLIDVDNKMYSDIKKSIDKLLKNKETITKIKKWDNTTNIINGLVVAYGVVDIDYVKKSIEKYCDYDKAMALIKLIPTSFSIEKKKIVSKLLSSRKRIDRYFSDNKYKEFTTKELKDLGANKYHYNIKEYKKLISLLKNYYVFKRKDIKFIDENIIIPYLYTSINEEEAATTVLMNRLDEYFEFRKDKLKDKLYKEVMGIRDNFPLWEYRGFSKKEVAK